MDMTKVEESIKAMNALTLIVSTEPTEVIGYLRGIMRNYPRHCTVVASRFLENETDNLVPVASYKLPKCAVPSRSSVGVICSVFDHNPKDEMFLYCMPDIFLDLGDRDVQASLLHLKDQVHSDDHLAKLFVIIAPSVEVLPPILKPYVEIVYDRGLTSQQAYQCFRDTMVALGYGARLGVFPQGMIEEIGRGLSRYEFVRAIAYSIVKTRDDAAHADCGVTIENMQEFRMLRKGSC
jgi:hypothetical protein